MLDDLASSLMEYSVTVFKVMDSILSWVHLEENSNSRRVAPSGQCCRFKPHPGPLRIDIEFISVLAITSIQKVVKVNIIISIGNGSAKVDHSATVLNGVGSNPSPTLLVDEDKFQ